MDLCCGDRQALADADVAMAISEKRQYLKLAGG
jgi:hypothetical protein